MMLQVAVGGFRTWNVAALYLRIACLAYAVVCFSMSSIIVPHSFSVIPDRSNVLGLQLVPAVQLPHADSQPPHVKLQDAVDGISWHELNGCRVQYVTKHVFSPRHDFAFVTMALLVGMADAINYSMFKGASRHILKPMLPDLVNLAYNPSMAPRSSDHVF
jgi:hypothetical protein